MFLDSIFVNKLENIKEKSQLFINYDLGVIGNQK